MATQAEKISELEHENNRLEQDLHKAQLKNTALNQRVASLTSDYENQVADLRVELTIMNEAYQQEAPVVQDED